MCKTSLTFTYKAVQDNPKNGQSSIRCSTLLYKLQWGIYMEKWKLEITIGNCVKVEKYSNDFKRFNSLSFEDSFSIECKTITIKLWPQRYIVLFNPELWRWRSKAAANPWTFVLATPCIMAIFKHLYFKWLWPHSSSKIILLALRLCNKSQY